MCDRDAWLFKSNRVVFARFVLLAVSEEARTWLHFFFRFMYNKKNIENIKGLGKC